MGLVFLSEGGKIALQVFHVGTVIAEESYQGGLLPLAERIQRETPEEQFFLLR